jgi:hypothetical protein
MTRSEALTLYGRLGAAFPSSTERTTATRELWIEHLLPVSTHVGRAAVESVIVTWRGPGFPTIAVFAAAVDECRRAEVERPSNVRALPAEPVASRERTNYWVARCRETLAAAGGPKRKPTPLPEPRRRTSRAMTVNTALAQTLDNISLEDGPSGPDAAGNDQRATEDSSW